jgi:glutathione S-transferase
MAVQVGKARKRYGVAYPNLYAPPGGDGDRFNCIQRGHQNTLEATPSHFTLMIVAGLTRPVPAAVAGAIFLAGRIAYFTGYATGVPSARARGAFGHLGSLALLIITARSACALLRS